MKRRRPCRRRLLAPVVVLNTAPDPETRSGREIIEEAMHGFITAGRQMIGAGVEAIVDAAAAHGFDGPEWEATAIRPAIVEIVAPRLHAILAETMQPDARAGGADAGPEGVRQSTAPFLADRLFTVVETECWRYGFGIENRHVKRLRECLHELVAEYGSHTPELGVSMMGIDPVETDRVRGYGTVIPFDRQPGYERDAE
jgi:hypothetical protein